MIFKTIFIILLFISNLYSLAVTSDDNYKIYKSERYTIIYTPSFEKEAKKIKENIEEYLEKQNKSYGFSFDEPIFISLISPNIELTNAFSTQIPFNETLLYSGGVQRLDYFSSNSWLDTLIYHEISHNYQLNAKNNEVSQNLHKYLGNNLLPLFVPIPLFTLPNLLIPTALLEGNAVLNESIHQNGGRLYNGRFKALTNLLILHNKMDKTRFINDHMDFPYGEEKYIVGGYFMLYLANKFGVDKVNRFFLEQSSHFINPLIVNDTFSKHFGDSFDNLFYYFLQETKKAAKDFHTLEDNSFISSSKKEIYLNKQNKNIYFLSNNKITKPQLNIYNIKTNTLDTQIGNYLNGKVFKTDDKYYTSAQTYIKSTLLKNGLFDKDRYIKEDTSGKVIQDIFEGHQLYFDVKNSFDTPNLYLNGVFYDSANSSALFDDKGNIYYFKQEKENRVLYKNKKRVFSFKGYFSKPVDIKDDTIYFIANSKQGSTLYKYDGKIKRVSNYDNIIDAKLLDNKKALIVSINHDNYRVYKIDLKDTNEEIFSTNIKVDDKTPFKSTTQNTKNQKLQVNNYNELKELRFSYLYPSFGYSSDDGALYTLDAYFLDPLMFNLLGVYAYKIEDERYVGFDYINERYIPFKLNIYDSEIEEPSYSDRGYGAYLSIYGPLYKAGAHTLEVELKKYFDDENKHKSPLTFTASHDYTLEFGNTIEPYFNSTLETYLKDDRDDTIYGASLNLTQHLFKETYIKGSIKSITSDVVNLNAQRGIKVYEESLTSMDDSDIYAPGIDDDFFVKDITKSSIELSSTINLNKYFFTFPLSLNREHIYIKYNDYTYTRTKENSFDEKIFGITFDTLFIHKLSIPIDIKYVENSISVDDYKIVLSIGASFW